MNWCLVKIALVTCALVICVGEVESSEDHSHQVESVEHDLESDQDDYYNEEDEERRKHHYHRRAFHPFPFGLVGRKHFYRVF